jgi:AAA ATPase domain
VPHMPIPSREAPAAVPGVAGRAGELAGLADLLSRAGLGRATVAVIRGETGCGKTHLLNAVADRARAHGWRCLTMQGVESGAVLSGAGLLPVLSPLRRGRITGEPLGE